MDLDYIQQLEQQNEMLTSKLAASQESCEKLREGLAGRRYEIFTRHTTTDDSTLTLCNFHSDVYDSLDDKLHRIQESVKAALFNQPDDDAVDINCVRYYTHMTYFEWSCSIYKDESTWRYFSFKIRGVERIKINHPEVIWLVGFNQNDYETIR